MGKNSILEVFKEVGPVRPGQTLHDIPSRPHEKFSTFETLHKEAKPKEHVEQHVDNILLEKYYQNFENFYRTPKFYNVKNVRKLLEYTERRYLSQILERLYVHHKKSSFILIKIADKSDKITFLREFNKTLLEIYVGSDTDFVADLMRDPYFFYHAADLIAKVSIICKSNTNDVEQKEIASLKKILEQHAKKLKDFRGLSEKQQQEQQTDINNITVSFEKMIDEFLETDAGVECLADILLSDDMDPEAMGEIFTAISPQKLGKLLNKLAQVSPQKFFKLMERVILLKQAELTKKALLSLSEYNRNMLMNHLSTQRKPEFRQIISEEKAFNIANKKNPQELKQILETGVDSKGTKYGKMAQAAIGRQLTKTTNYEMHKGGAYLDNANLGVANKMAVEARDAIGKQGIGQTVGGIAAQMEARIPKGQAEQMQMKQTIQELEQKIQQDSQKKQTGSSESNSKQETQKKHEEPKQKETKQKEVVKNVYEEAQNIYYKETGQYKTVQDVKTFLNGQGIGEHNATYGEISTVIHNAKITSTSPLIPKLSSPSLEHSPREHSH
jgi:hypothetical protein